MFLLTPSTLRRNARRHELFLKKRNQKPFLPFLHLKHRSIIIHNHRTTVIHLMTTKMSTTKWLEPPRTWGKVTGFHFHEAILQSTNWMVTVIPVVRMMIRANSMTPMTPMLPMIPMLTTILIYYAPCVATK